jgi:putative Mg2+ transporter-C (MgtC) family protein
MAGWPDGLRDAFPDLADSAAAAAAVVRLAAAAGLGAVVGWQRERWHKPAGVRTHMLVSLGAAAFVVGASRSGLDPAAVSRVVQGLVAGVGFIGAGAILRRDEGHVAGLTTAASVWVAAAIGTAAGLGSGWVAAGTAVLALVILALGWADRRPGGPAGGAP